MENYVRDNFERTYTGRRRLAGNYGRVWIWRDDDDRAAGEVSSALDETLIFEIKSFNATISVEREDVWVGISKDSKAVGYTGEGEIVIDKVFDRGFHNLVDLWQKGHDTRFVIVASLTDPDAIGNGEERVRIANVWINEVDLLRFEKGAVTEATLPFGFTPSDVSYTSWIGGPGIPGPGENG